MYGPRPAVLHVTAALVLALLVALSPPAVAQSPAEDTVGSVSSRPPRPGDLIRLQVWREPELSGEFLIDETGEVVLPRLGPVKVTGESPQSLKARVVQEYSRFLTHTSIDVALLRRIQVLGAVRNPGLYPVDATMSVSDALALAGGATTEGNPKRVELVRNGKKIEGRLSMDARLANTPMQSGDQLFVPERSWLMRNSGILAAGMSASVSLIIALLTR